MRLCNSPPGRVYLLDLRVEHSASYLLELPPRLLYEGGVLLPYPLWVRSFGVGQSPRIRVLTHVDHVQFRVCFLRELHRRLRRMGGVLRAVDGQKDSRWEDAHRYNLLIRLPHYP